MVCVRVVWLCFSFSFSNVPETQENWVEGIDPEIDNRDRFDSVMREGKGLQGVKASMDSNQKSV